MPSLAELPQAHRYFQGEIYNRRRDIHGVFGGQQQGGIITPKAAPYVFLITDDRGEEFGYRDEFRDGVFLYTGEGQVGDMKMDRGNAAVVEAKNHGKKILLFEGVRKGWVRFVGEAEYIGHHTVERPDREGNGRLAIVFELDVDAANVGFQVAAPARDLPNPNRVRDDDELKRLALLSASANAPAKERRAIARVRAIAIKRYVLRRAKGRCEACHQEAPFKTKRKQPYLEPHHTTLLADGGPDHPAHVIALCPNCHRRAHFAKDAEEFNDKLRAILRDLEG